MFQQRYNVSLRRNADTDIGYTIAQKQINIPLGKMAQFYGKRYSTSGESTANCVYCLKNEIDLRAEVEDSRNSYIAASIDVSEGLNRDSKIQGRRISI